MALNIGRAIGRGVRRTLNPVGGLIAVLTFGYVLAFVAGVNSLVGTVLSTGVSDAAGIGLALPGGPTVAGVVLAVAFLVGTAVYLAATRAFTRDPAECGTFRVDLFTRRMGRAVWSAVAANVVVTVAVAVGFALLVVPGLFLSVSFAFVLFAVGVEDARALPALRRSWAISRGNRFRILVLAAVVGVTVGTLGSVGALVTVADPALGQVLSLAVSAPASTAGYGVLADAYLQLRADA